VPSKIFADSKVDWLDGFCEGFEVVMVIDP